MRHGANGDDRHGLSVGVWNVHRGRWNDGCQNPAGTVDVFLREVWPRGLDLMVFVEADEEARPQRGVLDLRAIAHATGLVHAQADPALRWGPQSHGFHGVVVLARPDIVLEGGALMDLPGQCHRGAVALDCRRDGNPFRLIATHLSLAQPLRIAQMRTLGQFLSRSATRPTVLCGDLNEWRPWGGLAFAPRVTIRRFAGPARRSFPAGRPLLPLDRVLGADGARVTAFEVLDGPGLRAASDHRPVRAEVVLDPAPGG
ncbi:endonuclease/exonuclease/phosphatase family protein [Roseivivax isoporae]|uniref:Endonuclease/exonuclease/phosphatase domain-containing protein n=1 Tax=Roseivivax isoporae LMG 25204 TaxID=1449351 RepID=X7F7M0_9RHOB|nr:endonuclease/exonuclease/phosphatase family protein [Roseivivax isoporae]ETX28922.1 hypothetical protein RISW2_04205 [Roseivivax isoporae LMG 25204]